jgi:8-oxo-dGTP pyrophosphatase MutT (NUDIX family)
MAATPRSAATVILMRTAAGGSVETFLLKRHEASAFMGGNFVYPGGSVEPGDKGKGILPYCKGLPLDTSRAPEKTNVDELLGYRICAVRELFEEAGILLACRVSGGSCTTEPILSEDRLSEYRRQIDEDEISMTDLARQESLSYDLDQLIYIDRWITPKARHIRFDTRFYLAFCPEGQHASHDQKETVQGLWMSPCEAIDANLRGSIALSPPAVETIEMLSPFETRSSLLGFLEGREPRNVLPILTKATDGPVILFPWDEDYEVLNQLKSAQPRPSRLRNDNEKTTRVLLKDGRWLPCRPEENAP